MRRTPAPGFRKDSRELAVLAVPLAITQLAQVALTTSDTAMMGLIGAEALAAGGLAVVLFNQLRTMGVGLVTAVGNQIAAATAAESGPVASRHPDGVAETRRILRASVAVATLAGVLGAAIMIGLSYLLGFLGQDPAVAAAARPTVLALAPGLLPCLWFQVLRQFTVGMRRPKALVWITLVSIAVNIGLNLVFIYGVAGFPRLGLPGIGVSTSLVYLLSFLTLLAIVRRDERLAPSLSLRGWAADAATVRRLLRLGVPIAATYGSEAGFFTVVAVIMGTFGAPTLAAHTVANQLVYIVFQVSVGISHAASILVSRASALGDLSGVNRVVRTAFTHGALVAAVVAVAYVAVPQWVLLPFFDAGSPDDAPALAMASQLLLVAAVLQFADSAQNIGVGLLRGLNDTASGFRMTLVGYWLIGLPAAWLIGIALGAGPVGVWSGLGVGLAATAILLAWWFRRRLAEVGPALDTAGLPR
jgi:MATE family multidrug resistance protein